VEAVLAILRKEFELTMKQSGTTTLSQISARHITAA
jgi:isopentenyl diphosphate isomerase/L-lactate dehydrogenase-like FMN-dependent dehydrogenase